MYLQQNEQKIKVISIFYLFFTVNIFAGGLPSNFNWKSEYFTVYWELFNNIPTSVTSPYYSNITGGVAFTKDYETTDGWNFVYGDFGSSSGYVSDPYFIMYNKYQGLLRVFILVNSPENYTQATMQISFVGSPSKTALLTHASERAWATDNYLPDNIILGTSDMINYNWFYADFAMAYDPNTYNSTNSQIEIKLLGVQTTYAKINGTINLTQEIPKSSTNSDNLSEFNNLVLAGKGVAGYYNTFNGYKAQFVKAKNKETDSKLKSALTTLSQNWIVKNFSAIGAAVGLVNFFVGGGRTTKTESPVPMVFNGDMSLSGTLTTKETIFRFSLPTPGARHTNSSFVPYYDKPLGIFNLTKTPVLLSRSYYEPINSSSSMQYYSYKIKNDLNYAINPHSNLNLINLDVALVFRFDQAYDYPYNSIPSITNWLNSGIYEIETSRDSKYPVLRSKYIPYSVFKNTVINVPPGTDITIKVKATLRPSGASSDTQDVLFIADYEPHFESAGNGSKYGWNANQLVPYKPKNLVCTYNSSNHPELKWDLATGVEKYEIWKKSSGTWSKRTEVEASINSYVDLSETKYNPAYGSKTYKYYKVRAIDYGGNQSVYSNGVSAIVNENSPVNKKNVDNLESGEITEFFLHNNYPNPFNPTTQINYQIPENEFVTIKIYNSLGEEVRTLVNDYQSSGYYNIKFDGSELSSGIYFYKLQAGEYVSVKKMLLTK